MQAVRPGSIGPRHCLLAPSLFSAGSAPGVYAASLVEPKKAPLMSTKADKTFALDYQELEDLQQIGQGSFGIVYRYKPG